jgi:hypothetical protein
MEITNLFNLPEPVVLALSEDDYSRGESNRSVTQLIDAPRARILRQELDHLVTKDVSELIWIALGKTIHNMFEKYAQGKYLPEERLFAEVDGWVISGAIDIQYDEGSNHVTLTDYKCTSVWSVIYGKDDEEGAWAKQLNFYAWLATVAKSVIVDKLKIVVVLRDWKMREAQQNKGGNYPQAPIMEIDVPLWSESVRADYVDERVRIHQDAEFQRLTGGILPVCTDKERWKNPSQFAVRKPQNKTAKRVLDTYEQAEEYIEWIGVEEDKAIAAREVQRNQAKAKGEKKKPAIKKNLYIIEERPSTPNRCAMGYCHIAQWCDQYQDELKQAKEEANE